MSLRNITAWAVFALMLMPAIASADHEFDNTNDDGGALLLSSTSTTTTAVVGGIILTVVLASDADSMENYLEDNAVALQQDLSLGAGETVDDLALAFQVAEEDRATFGKIVRSNRATLLELANPEQLDTERARAFVEVLVTASVDAGIVDLESFAT